MIPIFLLHIGDVFQFPEGTGKWKIIDILSDEKVICREQETNTAAWFWSNRLVIQIFNF